jgi:hypothetical protein
MAKAKPASPVRRSDTMIGSPDPIERAVPTPKVDPQSLSARNPFRVTGAVAHLRLPSGVEADVPVAELPLAGQFYWTLIENPEGGKAAGAMIRSADGEGEIVLLDELLAGVRDGTWTETRVRALADHDIFAALQPVHRAM